VLSGSKNTNQHVGLRCVDLVDGIWRRDDPRRALPALADLRPQLAVDREHEVQRMVRVLTTPPAFAA
jgi:hypothetical protein